MAEYRIGVIGIPGKWSTETLADSVEAATGFRLVIDMGETSLDLASGEFTDLDQCRHQGDNKHIDHRPPPDQFGDPIEPGALVLAQG